MPNLHDLAEDGGLGERGLAARSLGNRGSGVNLRLARLVISSSLHGLVVADAFGIPCTYLRLSEEENILKYEDYALGVGRRRLAVTRSREEAVRAETLSPRPLILQG